MVMELNRTSRKGAADLSGYYNLSSVISQVSGLNARLVFRINGREPTFDFGSAPILLLLIGYECVGRERSK